MILDKIIESKRKAISRQKSVLPKSELLKKLGSLDYVHRDFKASISKSGMALIAELKKASPSAGTLRKMFSPTLIAQIYQSSGVNALSILTEEEYFLGSPAYIGLARETSALPILRKDFIVDEYQVYESKLLKADAILLITELLTLEELKKFKSIADEIGLECLVESHTEEGLDKALAIDAPLIGINNRDLHKFDVDLSTTQRLINMVPEDKIVVSESGINSYEDVMFLKSLGVRAVLIGEAFMKSDNISLKVKQIMGW